MPKALTLSGSIRKGSYNQMLALHVGKRLRDAGVEVTDVDLADYPMPIFNEDLEPDNMPESAARLADLWREADIIFIASPEYNGGMTPLLLNTITWLSRQKPGGLFRKPVIGIGGVSSGKYGTIWSLSHLRDSLSKVGGLIVPGLLGIGPSDGAFDDNGNPVEPAIRNKVDALIKDLISVKRG